MFKDADFSAVAVDQVPTGVVVLTPVINTERSIDASETVINTEGWAVYYVPIVAGRTYNLSIVWSAVHYQRVGVSSVVPSVGVVMDTMLVNQQGGAQYATTTADVSYTAVSNGYLVWQMHVADAVSCVIKEWSV